MSREVFVVEEYWDGEWRAQWPMRLRVDAERIVERHQDEPDAYRVVRYVAAPEATDEA